MAPHSAHYDWFCKGLEDSLRTELRTLELGIRKGERPSGSEVKRILEGGTVYVVALTPFRGLMMFCQMKPFVGPKFLGPYVFQNGDWVEDYQALEKLKSPGLNDLL
ncbi:MAG: hypothetical protein A2600_12140 [Candidatus Lambdaproteobacteria bacterium RIFOXYD1_FULL_56_27]|uniref:Uncharacterized protein n=1 Tax=Candidatus Lambdaproteobacteria bacterium RIFOXYD2_FULL_56_26 TaxID=1817773 RepID=A0A1F6GMH1_9PROT|nr:MAG: hypothetical protein A2557_00890 [Candidatus Lambdaproteobacteria bacterium RIFOXYD2_FULL_56_26]OGH09860.1 MAG: hypothetical protein A2600_12140 [Candidatus Lambdaproteobacteria bacterium RIFOXYD1_FULL_56_27]